MYVPFSLHDVSVEHFLQTLEFHKAPSPSPALSQCLPSHSWMVPPASTPSAPFDRITHMHSLKLSSAAPSCRMLSSCVPALTDNPGKEGETERAQRVTLGFWVIWEVASEGNLKLFSENERSGTG